MKLRNISTLLLFSCVIFALHAMEKEKPKESWGEWLLGKSIIVKPDSYLELLSFDLHEKEIEFLATQPNALILIREYLEAIKQEHSLRLLQKCIGFYPNRKKLMLASRSLIAFYVALKNVKSLQELNEMLYLKPVGKIAAGVICLGGAIKPNNTYIPIPLTRNKWDEKSKISNAQDAQRAWEMWQKNFQLPESIIGRYMCGTHLYILKATIEDEMLHEIIDYCAYLPLPVLKWILLYPGIKLIWAGIKEMAENH